MAFPTTGTINDFNGANANGLGAAYVKAFNFGSASDRIGILSGKGHTVVSLYGEDAFDTTSYLESEVYVTLTDLPTGTAPDYGCCARYSGSAGSAAGYRLTITHASGAWTVNCVTGGTSSRPITGSATQALSAGDSYGMEITGSGATVTIKLYYKAAAGSWTLLTTLTDTNAARITTSGKVGVYLYQGSGGAATGRIDNFSGGEVSAGSTPIAGSDAFTVTDANSGISQSLTDSGTLTESVTNVDNTQTVAEGTLSESAAVTVGFSATDSIVFSEGASVAVVEFVSASESFAVTDAHQSIGHDRNDSASGTDSSSLDIPTFGDGYITKLPTDVIGSTQSSQVNGTVRTSEISSTSRTTQLGNSSYISSVGGTSTSTDTTGNGYTSDVAESTRTTTTIGA